MLETLFIKPILWLSDMIHRIRYGIPSRYEVMEKVMNPLIPRKVQRIGVHYALLCQKYPEANPRMIVKMMSNINGNPEHFNISMLRNIVSKK